jgi:hypothetical protein
MLSEVELAEYLEEIRKQVATAASSGLRTARRVPRWASCAASNCTCPN